MLLSDNSKSSNVKNFTKIESSPKSVYVPKYVYSLLLYFSSHYINLMCTPLSTLPPAPSTKKKILDKNDENFLVVVMCVVNKLTHLPALPVRSYWLMLCFSLPNFENRICLRFSTTILQIANSYLHAKYLLE